MIDGFCRYGLITEMQVSQTDVGNLESKWGISVLRIRHCPQAQAGVQAGSNPNETTLILNLVCDQVIANWDSNCLKDLDHQAHLNYKFKGIIFKLKVRMKRISKSLRF